MRNILLLTISVFISFSGRSQSLKIQDPVHFLALGDSYTIGQSVSIADRWPNQFTAELTKLGFNVAEVKFIAQTGWRTDNLKNAITQQQPLSGFNLVSLLIGVNNQYQGGSTSTYFTEFDELLQTALQLAAGKPENVFVLSIPDYAYTPYCAGNTSISRQIDQFNEVNKIISERYKVKYINITPISRSGLSQPELVATDGLHPSGIMYALWVQEIMKNVEKELGFEDEILVKQSFSYTVSQKILTFKTGPASGRLQIININGQAVYNQLISGNNETTVKLRMLADGIYFLIFKNDSKMPFKTKFILH
jgi:lysophospholipase L1-like esterase